MAKAEKGRHWAYVVYPESAPPDWVDRLRGTGLMGAISPLHDKDVEVEGKDDEAKKAHWHVILCWDGPTTYNCAKSIADKMLKCPVPQKLNNVRGYYRYFTHKDHPDKHQYDPDQIQHFGGFAPSDFDALSRAEIEVIKRKVSGYIRELNIIEYCDLVEMLEDSEAYEMLSIAMSNTLYFGKLIDSRRNRDKERKAAEQVKEIEMEASKRLEEHEEWCRNKRREAAEKE